MCADTLSSLESRFGLRRLPITSFAWTMPISLVAGECFGSGVRRGCAVGQLWKNTYAGFFEWHQSRGDWVG